MEVLLKLGDSPRSLAQRIAVSNESTLSIDLDYTASKSYSLVADEDISNVLLRETSGVVVTADIFNRPDDKQSRLTSLEASVSPAVLLDMFEAVRKK